MPIVHSIIDIITLTLLTIGIIFFFLKIKNKTNFTFTILIIGLILAMTSVSIVLCAIALTLVLLYNAELSHSNEIKDRTTEIHKIILELLDILVKIFIIIVIGTLVKKLCQFYL